MAKIFKISLIVIFLSVLAAVWFSLRRNPSKEIESGNEQTASVAENLNIPWEIIFLPEGGMLVSERSGTIKLFGQEQKSFPVESLRGSGEGGLLGMAVHPEFQQNKWIYIYFTAQEGSKTINRIVRYSFDGSNFIKDRIILDDIPASANHNGGRLAFSPDGFLYVTTGDAEDAVLSQDVSSLAGKILRMRDDGSIPSDNPFGNAVWAFGFRNPQGLAWDSQGRLWATDHGRSGARSGLDELNLIEQGKNYGWPQIQGNQQKEGMQAPVLQSGNETWAPAGAVFLNGSVFFGGLRGEALYEAKITGNKIELKTHLKNEFGRIRAVVSGPDGSLYISTSNRDGRGAPKEGDDKIIKIDPKILN